MKHLTFLVLIIGYSFFAKAQEPIKVIGDSIVVDSTKFVQVDQEAQFPGGNVGWRNFLVNNLNIDGLSDLVKIPRKQKEITYKAILTFIVDKDGTLSDIRVKNDVPEFIAKEAIRVLKKSPNWIPASQNGRFVRAYRLQSILFYFNKD